MPRAGHPNSGLQALFFAGRYGDEVWALPAPGDYVGAHQSVRFFFLDRPSLKALIPLRVIRFLYLLLLFPRVLSNPGKLFIVHSFIFALPMWLLRRKYCIFIHGSDRRFLNTGWGKSVSGNALATFGVGFGTQDRGVNVQEIPNIFVPLDADTGEQKAEDIVFVLRNAAVKNPLYPLDLAGALGEKLGLAIAVIGVDSEELPKDKQAYLEDLKKRGVRIRYVGRQTLEEVMQWMRRSRILMIPSHAEGLPKALLEGMSQGLHVVINAPLVFTGDIMARVHRVDIRDWTAVEQVIQECRSLGRNAENVRFANEYLLQSHRALMDLYDQLYCEAGV